MTAYVEPTQVKNFTGVTHISISGDMYNQQPLVHLIQQAQGLRFQHSMTLEQAEEMCQRLKDTVMKLRDFKLKSGSFETEE